MTTERRSTDMSMSPHDWIDLASVYQAGADRARRWSRNSDRQQDADILEAQADRCKQIAAERNDLREDEIKANPATSPNPATPTRSGSTSASGRRISRSKTTDI
jgi:hypothetical protein